MMTSSGGGGGADDGENNDDDDDDDLESVDGDEVTFEDAQDVAQPARKKAKIAHIRR